MRAQQQSSKQNRERAARPNAREENTCPQERRTSSAHVNRGTAKASGSNQPRTPRRKEHAPRNAGTAASRADNEAGQTVHANVNRGTAKASHAGQPRIPRRKEHAPRNDGTAASRANNEAKQTVHAAPQQGTMNRSRAHKHTAPQQQRAGSAASPVSFG